MQSGKRPTVEREGHTKCEPRERSEQRERISRSKFQLTRSRVQFPLAPLASELAGMNTGLTKVLVAEPVELNY